MLALFVAAGLLAGGGGVIDLSSIPAARAASAALGDATKTVQPTVIWGEPFDPSDELPFLFKFDQVIDVGDTIADLASVVIGPSPAGLALGLTLTDEALSADKRGIAFVATVDQAYRANAAFDASGALLGIEAAILTAAGERFERTIYLRVVQQWTSVGDSIMDEVNRIRGLTDTTAGTGFASLMGQFNAATAAARAGDQDEAKNLPQLSQSLLTAAAAAATSRQELDRVQAQTAASLEATYAVVSGLATDPTTAGTSTSSSLETVAATQAATGAVASTDDVLTELKGLRSDVAQLRSDNNQGHANTAGKANSIDKKLGAVTQQAGGLAISTVATAA